MKRKGHLKMKIRNSKLTLPKSLRNSSRMQMSRWVTRIIRSLDSVIQIFKIPLLGFKFGSDRLILSLCFKSMQIFKIPFFGFKFGNNRLILSLLLQKFPKFQNTSLGIQIWQRPFNPMSPLGFKFNSDCLILCLFRDSDSVVTV